MRTIEHPTTFLDLVWNYKGTMAIYVLQISLLTFVFLYLVGGVPNELRTVDVLSQGIEAPLPAGTMPAAAPSGPLPERIIIDKIGVNTPIQHPTSKDINVLNNALLKGAVHYPGSGVPGQGNMFVFGHSTSYKVVNNQAFKAFNKLSELVIGDKIKVVAEGKTYTYKVTNVELVDSDKALVDLSSTKSVLTLSTCNVFGEKQERIVVEAILM